jgi:serine/threonine protein kinase
MVHRDIKPSKLMSAREGNKPVIKVLDFGLAKITSEGLAKSGLTHEGQMLGTPAHIAPEQIKNARSADIRADIYGLGCTLYNSPRAGRRFAATASGDGQECRRAPREFANGAAETTAATPNADTDAPRATRHDTKAWG